MDQQDDRTTLLIVDDEVDMRVLVRLLMESAGPDLEVVGEAADGNDAVAAFDRLGAPPNPRVVLLDNRMPGLSGLEAAAQMLERVPGQRIVLFTAAVSDDLIAEAASLGITQVLSKSEIHRLADVVRRISA